MKKILLGLILLTSIGAHAQVVNTGTSANAGDGDNLREAFVKVNSAFQYHSDSLVLVMDSLSAHRTLIDDNFGYIAVIMNDSLSDHVDRIEAVESTNDNQSDSLITLFGWGDHALEDYWEHSDTTSVLVTYTHLAYVADTIETGDFSYADTLDLLATHTAINYAINNFEGDFSYPDTLDLLATHTALDFVADNASYTAGDGLTLAGNEFNLGGSINNDVSLIGGNKQSILFGVHNNTGIDTSSYFQQEYNNIGNKLVDYVSGVSLGVTTSLNLEGVDDGTAMWVYQNTGNNLSQLSVSQDSMYILDQINSKGLVYSEDYSSNFTDRSLVDKAYVDWVASTGGGAFDTTNIYSRLNSASDSIETNASDIATLETEVNDTLKLGEGYGIDYTEAGDSLTISADTTELATLSALSDTAAAIRGDIPTSSGGSGGYSLLEYTIGTTTNAPSAGDSLLTHGSLLNKSLEVYRASEYGNLLMQVYRDTLGYEVSDSTLTVHPVYADGDIMRIHIYDSTDITDAKVFSFASTDGNTNQDYDIKLPVGKSITIDWGDGTSNSYDGNDDTVVNLTHIYSEAGSYDITFKGDYLDLTYLHCGTNSLEGDVSSWSALTNLNILRCHSNSLSGDVSSWSALTKLTYLSCNSNSLEGDVSSWSALTKLTYLRCNSNSLEGDVSSWSALTKLTYLRCNSNSLDFDSTTAWAALDLGTNCQLQDNSMNSTQVNNALIAFAGGPFTNTTIDLGADNAARTSDSDAAVATLLAAGCTVKTNGLTEEP